MSETVKLFDYVLGELLQPMERFHSRDQHLCKFIGKKERFM